MGHQGRRGFVNCILAQPILLPRRHEGLVRLTGYGQEAEQVNAAQVQCAIQPDVVVSDLSGQQLLNTRRTLSEAPLPRTVFSELRRQANPMATLVSGLYFAPFGRQYSFAVEVPVVIKGQRRYYLSVGGYASYLQELLKEQRVPASWTRLCCRALTEVQSSV